MPQTDLFGQPAGGSIVNTSREMMHIPGNAVLEKACARLLKLIRENPSLIDGDTIGEVDRKLFAEVLWEDCFKAVVAPEKKYIFINAMKKAPEQDVLTRARRELQARDYIRLSSKAVKSGEGFRQRIAGAMNKEA